MKELREEVLRAAGEMQAGGADALPQSLNGFLRAFLAWPFLVRDGTLVDTKGNESDPFSAVVFTSQQGAADERGAIAVGTAAVVIDARPRLDLSDLREAFGRIAKAKHLEKGRPPAVDFPIATSTMGVVFALESDISLETLAAELRVLNTTVPWRERLDMVVVAGKGTIQYMVQIPGAGTLADTLPGEQPKSGYPGVYTVMAIKPAGDYTLNRMLALIIGYLKVFLPGTALADWSTINRGVVNRAFAIVGYQHRMDGALVEAPRSMYSDRYIAPLPIEVLDRKGKHLAFVRRLPWQDGAVILVEGSFPLAIVLECCGRDSGGSVKWEKVQVSGVLDLSEDDFRRGMVAVQKRTRGIALQPVKPSWTMKVFENEGASSPVMARLFLGVLDLRDNVFPDALEREAFDKKFETLWSALSSTRAAERELSRLWSFHMEGVGTGAAVEVVNGVIRERSDIDGPLRRGAETFLIGAVRTTKNGLQEMAALLGGDLGFFFKKEGAFATGLKELEGHDPDLAAYLKEARVWHEVLVKDRNRIEHESWKLAPTRYTLLAGGEVKAAEPEVSGKPVTIYTRETSDRICAFVEETLVHLLQRALPDEFTITEISKSERDSEVPKRFRLTPRIGGQPHWRIGQTTTSFSGS